MKSVIHEKKIVSMIKKNDLDSILKYIKEHGSKTSWEFTYKGEYLYLYFLRKCRQSTFSLDTLTKYDIIPNVALAMEYMIKFQAEHLVAYYLGLHPFTDVNITNRERQIFAIQCISHGKLLVFECFINKKSLWNLRDNTGKNLAMYLAKYAPIECHSLVPVERVLWNQKDNYNVSTLEYYIKYSDKKTLDVIFQTSLPLCIPKTLFHKEYTNRHLLKTTLDIDTRCCICLDHYTNYGEYNIYKSKCNHMFHLKCVKKLIKCPLCRNNF